MLRHAKTAHHMAMASQQHHGAPGQGYPADGLRHSPITGYLHAGHGRNLALGQELAVAIANALLLGAQCSLGQGLVQAAVLHGGAQVGARQVGAEHRHTPPHCGHDGRPVGSPRPSALIPVQRSLHLRRTGLGAQALG